VIGDFKHECNVIKSRGGCRRPGTAVGEDPLGKAPFPKTARFGNFWMAARLITALLDPKTNLLLDGKPERRRIHKFRFE
jgi:hypothetical protein